MERTLFGGRKHDAKHTARKLGDQLLLFARVYLKLLLQPVVCALRAFCVQKNDQEVRQTHVERTSFGGRKHDAKHAARKLVDEFFATTCLRQW